jgi:hypothetical protein
MSSDFSILRAEVNKCSITHWFVVEKASRELGYRPLKIPIEETVAWFRERGFVSTAETNIPNMHSQMSLRRALLWLLLVAAPLGLLVAAPLGLQLQ